MAGTLKTVSPHIAYDDRGRPIIAGGRFKVSILVGYHKHWKLSAEQLADNFPTLTKPEIYAALLYYYENQAEMDAEAEREREWLDDYFSKHGSKVTRAELEARLAAKAEKQA